MEELETPSETHVPTPTEVVEQSAQESAPPATPTSEPARIARSSPDRRRALCVAQGLLQGTPGHGDLVQALAEIADHCDLLEEQLIGADLTIEELVDPEDEDDGDLLGNCDEGPDFVGIAKLMANAMGGGRTFRQSIALEVFARGFAKCDTLDQLRLLAQDAWVGARILDTECPKDGAA